MTPAARVYLELPVGVRNDAEILEETTRGDRCRQSIDISLSVLSPDIARRRHEQVERNELDGW
jgi:hypothetical protein